MGIVRSSSLFVYLIAGFACLAVQRANADSFNERSDTAVGAARQAGCTTVVGGVNGGQQSVGCLGCIVSLRGTIMKVYPESDLNRFGIEPKDKVLTIDGHKFNLFKFQKECVGTPGTEIQLCVVHEGKPQDITVRRVDSILLASHAKRYRQLSEQAKYW